MGKSTSNFFLKHAVKISLFTFILVLILSGIASSQKRAPVYPPEVSGIEALKQSVEPLMKMSIKEVINEVPTKSGFFFIGCPNCNGGAEEAGVLGWKHGMGDEVKCNFCQMIFPNDKFHNNRETVIIAPSGVRQIYRYYESPQGRQYFYESHAWYERWRWINSMAEQLARLWFATKDNAYGDRAAAIAGRFAQVFPDYAVRFDYPERPKKFFPANQKFPYEGIPLDYRGAKWDWWAYMDIPAPLTNVYDMLSTGYDWKRMDTLIGAETDQRIVKDLLRLGYEFTVVNPDDYGNMSPRMYQDMIRVGRVINEPEMVHEAMKRLRELLYRGFFADGWWREGSPSYHNQTIGGLRGVADVLKGYTDPADWKGERFDNMNLTVEMPLYEKALLVSREAILPNGRALPINDTWASDRNSEGENTGSTVSRLWSSLGNAALGTGEGENQFMLNVNWSGNYGHAHSDNGSIILYAAGQELLSDIGYTNTRYRAWASSIASHNTVVIDQKDQDGGSAEKPVTGNLNFYDDKDSHIKAIDLDASPAYAVAKTYRRRLVTVHAGPGKDYVVDRFDVEGGQDHDWFLHGMCEEQGTLETSIPLDHPLATLVPSWGINKLAEKKADTDPKLFHPYSYLRDIKSGEATAETWTATWRYGAGVGLRVHNISQAGTQAFRFSSPSVRPAKEDANKLESFMHNGIMQRSSEKVSTFLTVHEPFRNNPWIKSVQNDGDALVVRYKLNGTDVEDRILLNENGEIVVSSSTGWKYNSGMASSGKVQSLKTAGGKFKLYLDRDAPKVNFVRLDLADGGTRYYPVASVQGKTLELVDDPGFTIGTDGKVKFHTFPQDQHEGPLGYTLFVQ